MRIDVLTLFPGLFTSFLSESIIKRAQLKRKVTLRIHNIRDYAMDRHRTCDDRPFGGGPGMILRPEPIHRLCLQLAKGTERKRMRFIFLTPAGKAFRQADAVRLAKEKRLVLLCGHYEGVDERVRELWIDEEISVGDYVLTGGELPAMVVMDAVIRLLKGVMGNEASKDFESFSGNLLEYPQYTRPEVFQGKAVPSVLLSGNHRAIEAWRREQSLQRTRLRRPDLQRKDHR